MSYQVLARKYRPKSFQTLVGQEHVVRALTHALEQQRLHHAYLFTGTRGVGKTTLSRILAKSLNCEQGVTATPCGQCETCLAIDSGRFVDYIEMDAASNRGVDEMTQLLEQAVYAPNNARFKIYMIDEVHMLTNHAFNSMLKTLEEPPPHVKFILATTDPQKIPVTVLSRCLQFNLKQMPAPTIIGHLENILAEENIQFERPALRLLANGAQGSMRDALSLTDQAIAYAAGTVTLDAVQGMLGALDVAYLIKILDALASEDGVALLDIAAAMQSRSLSFKVGLSDLASILHQVSVAQLAPQALAEELPERAEIIRLSETLDPELVQLFYQIAIHGRNELALAPDEFAGFSMTLLRMLAFRPVGGEAIALPESKDASVKKAPVRSAPIQAIRANSTPMPVPAPTPTRASAPAQVVVQESKESSDIGAETAKKKNPAMAALEALQGKRDKRNLDSATRPEVAEKKTELKSMPPEAVVEVVEVSPDVSGIQLKSGALWDGDWPSLAAQLPLRGVAQQLAFQSELASGDNSDNSIRLKLRVPLETLLASGSVEKLADSLSEYFALPVKISTEIGEARRTANAAALVQKAKRQDAAVAAISDDKVVQGLMRVFGASIIPGSIRPN